MSLEISLVAVREVNLFIGAITHNLGRMAYHVGIYRHLWRPEELGITQASELIEPLEQAIAKLEADPRTFKSFNPSNGWGDYETLLTFLRDVRSACKAHPDAKIRVSR